MSPSPSIALAEASDYRAGWKKLNRSLREGASWSGREPHSLFMSTGGTSRFIDASTALGFDLLDDGRALTPLDWDGDGDQDLCVTARTGPRFRLLDNRLLAAPRSVELLFETHAAGTVGARVVVSTKSRETARTGGVNMSFGTGRKLLRVLRAGEGYLAVDAPHLFFGLGAEDVASASIRWPGGETIALSGIDGPGRYFVPTGSTRARRETSSTAAALPSGALESVSSDAPVVLARPVILPKLEMRSKTGGAGALFGVQAGAGNEPTGTGVGQPALILLWASWCEPCLAELERLARDATVFNGESLVLALSLDEATEEAEAFRLLDALQWPGRAARATGETRGIIEALFAAVGDRRDALTFPAALVVDGNGAVVALHRGPWSGAVVLPSITPVERRAAAALEPGRWLKPTTSLGGLAFDSRLAEFGLDVALGERKLLEVDLGALNSRSQLLAERGLSLGANGDLPGAIDALEKAVLLEPSNQAALFNLAVALDRSGRPEDALRAFREAARLKPEDEASWLQIARIAVDRGDDAWREALVALRRLGSPGALQLKRVNRARQRSQPGSRGQ